MSASCTLTPMACAMRASAVGGMRAGAAMPAQVGLPKTKSS